ncbi:Grx4 family monothiol glutaredoxin [Candidatus Synchoanobacter obligatus]|uniref:Glutaredoxin n=1 Tax=Candidatus Synchoanobacter obligatus TaxID=2919597 RepID=A0ABT1L588_9GAMM|nr:Grx4 family monothiol glutaredoxin [Candidatus Synchoanobacter obligatus]MCP8352081.1 Grx4 family monothiol glutaredoxin [Candidatus Synchoanobacter obligatus]
MINETIKAMIESHQVVLFMKGSADTPQCGFSAHAVALLRKHQVAFHGENILLNPELRQGLKDFSDWPTFPQLYVQGEFMGGVDIMREMDEAGELAEALIVQA